MQNNDWIYENQTDGLRIGFKIKKELYAGSSDFQKINIYDTEDHGRLLMLDDLVMLTERNEYVYHEMISHVPLCVHPSPERILVIGGGDGGTLREVVKHESVKEAVLCEIDGLVIEKSKEYLPFTACGFDDPKVNVVVADGFKYLENNKSKFDVILVDSTEPIGESAKLFGNNFYTLCHSALKEDGIIAFQSESPYVNKDLISDVIRSSIRPLFSIASLYLAFIPDYPTGMWAFGMGSKKYHPRKEFIKKRSKLISKQTKYYNKDIHKSCFNLPNFVKELVI